MNKNLRKAVIAGNWKMNKTPAEAKALIEEAKPLLEGAGCDVIMCVPFVAPLSRRQRAQISKSAHKTAILKNPAPSPEKFRLPCLRKWALSM